MQPDIVFITEANLWEGTEEHLTTIEGYDLQKPATINRLGYSRIILLTKKSLQFKIMFNLMEDDLSTFWIKTGGRGSKGLVIGGIYREHTLLGQPMSVDLLEQENRWKRILCQWKKAGKDAACIVLGDLNIDMIRWQNPDANHTIMVEDSKEILEEENFSQIIEGATRFWQGQVESLLDQCWVNRPEKVLEANNICRAAADHNLIQVRYRLKGGDKKNSEIVKRQRSGLDPVEYGKEIGLINWDPLYAMTDIYLANSYFEEQILAVLNKMAPIIKYQPRQGAKNWLKKETRQKIHLRNLARENAAKSLNRDDWNLYRRLRNKCTQMVKNDRKSHFSNLNNKYIQNGDSSSLFALAKNRMNMLKSGPPTGFLKNGKMVSKPKEIANMQIEFFEKKVEKFIESLPNENIDPLAVLKSALLRWGDEAKKRPTLKLCKIGEIKTLNLLKKLGKSTSMGRDGLDAQALKMAAALLFRPLRFIINLSIESGKFANKWRLAKVVPLYKGKGKSRLSPESCRPISILPVVSKLVEMTVKTQIVDFMEQSKQWGHFNQAYRKHLNTTTTLLSLSDRLFEACEYREIAVAISIDNSAAFDCVSHVTLLNKFKLYNFDETTLKWLKSYLQRRTQYVVVGASESIMKEVKHGVPQGSVLGPTMYTIYTNEMSETINDHDTCLNEVHNRNEFLFKDECKKCGSLPSYADDSTYVCSSRNRDENQHRIREVLERIRLFLNSNQLSANKSKTTLIEPMLPQRRAVTLGQPPTIETVDENGDEKIVHTRCDIHLLGGTFHESLSWKAHVESGDDAILPRLRKNLVC